MFYNYRDKKAETATTLSFFFIFQVASIVMGFREALVEEMEREKLQVRILEILFFLKYCNCCLGFSSFDFYWTWNGIDKKIEWWLGVYEILKNVAQKNRKMTWLSKTMFLDGWVGGCKKPFFRIAHSNPKPIPNWLDK